MSVAAELSIRADVSPHRARSAPGHAGAPRCVPALLEARRIAPRYNGPPQAGNGGYVAGLLAAHAPGPVEVTLRRPAPLDRTLNVVRRAGGELALEDGGVAVAEARPTRLELEVPAAPSWAEAVEARGRALDASAEHPFRHCFVCGPWRREADGLRVFAGPLPGRAGVAAAWVPPAALAGADGFVPVELLWCAIDCPGAAAATAGALRPMLLGRIAGEVTGRVRAGERCIVTGWPIAREGRKHLTGTALFDASGRVAARAWSIWIEPRSAPRAA